MNHGYSADVSYTWSDTKDNQVGEGNGFSSAGNLLDNYNVEQEFGTSLQDLKHRLNVNVTYQLPFGEGRKWLNSKGLTNALLADGRSRCRGATRAASRRGCPSRATRACLAAASGRTWCPALT